MSVGEIIRFTLEVLVFAAWAFMAYRMVMTVRARDQAQGGGFLGQMKQWFKNEDDVQDRNTLVWLTLILAAMIATNVLLT